jgi:penicillin amidase
MKTAARFGIALAAALVIAAAAGYVWLRQSLPQMSGTLAVPGLAAAVEVIRDGNDVPHIYAKSVADAHFALGYVHAQDRLWQMEMNRRVAAARLSEIFGAATLDTDRFLRTLGVYRAAEATIPNLDAETRAALTAYAAGVNAFLSTRSGPLPPEFLALGVVPEPWKPADSVAWLKMMAWDLGGNWSTEILRLRLAQRLDSRQIAEFLPPYPGDAPLPVRDLAELYRGLAPAAATIVAIAPPSLPEGAGSNNWVIAGSRSASGKPLLANDPHLGLNVPAIWYFAHLSAPGLNAIGATLPGSPMLVLGRNDRIAWGFTNTGPDVQDLYIERIDERDPARYATPDGTQAFTVRTETIRVKGAPDETLVVRSTRHGPVISDVSRVAGAATPKGYAIAMQWTTLRDDDLTVEAGVMLPRASNWNEFLAGARHFHSPQQNMVYADVDGNVGFVAAGRVPIRRADNDLFGMAPAPGWDARYDWQGFIPFGDLPRAFNPASGKVVTANDKITPPGYPYFITSDWFAPYRSKRISELIDAQPLHSRDSFARVQADDRSELARDLLPIMLRAAPREGAAADLAAMLAHWDGSMDAGRPEPLIFGAWYRELTRRIYADELGPELFKDYWDQRAVFMTNVLSHPDDGEGVSRWCDDVNTPRRESCADEIAAALEDASVYLRAHYGADPKQWRWGTPHFSFSRHQPFTKNALLGPLFDLKQPSDGDSYTVNVGRYRIADEAYPFASVHGASLRAIYDLADPDRSVFIHSTGQSGNRLSPWYDAFALRWAHGEYVPMTTRRSEVLQGAIGTLVLVPGQSGAAR